MRFLYSISISFYTFLIRITSLFKPKAKAWIAGRKDVFHLIKKEMQTAGDQNAIWFHCASLGEFEQGRPVIEAFRHNNPDWKIILTFFSPSGYEVRKDYSGADHIFYLPADTLQNARRFVDLINPRIVVFVKYEFWFNYLKTLSDRKIPIIYVSSIFRDKQHFFKFWGVWFRKQLKRIDRFFLQNRESAELLKSIGINDSVISGDTRFDRVASIPGKVGPNSKVEEFVNKKSVFLAGSTWPEDEILIHKLYLKHRDKLRFIIAPHEVNEKHIQQIIKLFGKENVLRFTDAEFSKDKGNRVLIIDTIGHLSSLYQYASFAYIGGGFGAGIHNILEAATFAKPVIFGPEFKKFKEARDLIQLEGAFSINDFNALDEISLKLMSENAFYIRACRTNGTYVQENKGATDTILAYLDTLTHTYSS